MRKFLLPLAFVAFSAFAGPEPDGVSAPFDEAPSVEFDVESAYLLSVFNSPYGYEVNANFLTARVRWGNNLDSTGFLRGYNQVYFSAEAQPIIRGVENRYFGLNVGARYNFVRPHSRFVPFVSGGLGLGWIDSNAQIFGAQGQDFTFNILSAVGVDYRMSDHWKLSFGVLYEHFSNGGQTDPNPSLNLVGPQLGFGFTF